MPNARKTTEQLLKEMESNVDKMYAKKQIEIEKAWNDYMKKQEPKVHSLYAEMQKAKRTGDSEAIRIATEKYQKALEEVTLKSSEYRNLVNETKAEITKVNTEAIDYMNSQMAEIYAINFNEPVVAGMNQSKLTTDAVRNLAKNDRAFLPYKQLDKYKDSLWNEKIINSQVMQGIAQGESVYEIAKRMKVVIGMNNSSAIRNARTMVTAAENKGKFDSFHRARQKGVILTKMWLSAHDGHTRNAHLELDGVEIPLDEEFENSVGRIMYPGDPEADAANVYNCRCSLVSVVKGFEWE